MRARLEIDERRHEVVVRPSPQTRELESYAMYDMYPNGSCRHHEYLPVPTDSPNPLAVLKAGVLHVFYQVQRHNDGLESELDKGWS